MSDPIMWRGIERILIVLIALIFGYLGYKLFIHGIDKGKSELKLKSKFFDIIFSGRGPGLFFMAFAAIIMAFAIFKGGAESTKKILPLPQVEKAASKKAQPELTISTNKQKQRRKKGSQSESVTLTVDILKTISEPKQSKVSPDRNIKNLIQALKDEDYGVRRSSAYDLGEIKSEKAVEPLIQALKDKYPGVCGEAAHALVKIKLNVIWKLNVIPLLKKISFWESTFLKSFIDGLFEI